MGCRIASTPRTSPRRCTRWRASTRLTSSQLCCRPLVAMPRILALPSAPDCSPRFIHRNRVHLHEPRGIAIASPCRLAYATGVPRLTFLLASLPHPAAGASPGDCRQGYFVAWSYGSGGCPLEVAGSLVPIHNVPPYVDVVGTLGLVL